MRNVEVLEDLPRAPSQAEWDAMSPEERLRIVDALPCTMTDAELTMPEGDGHRLPIRDVEDALGGYFGRRRCTAYVGVDLLVYYPNSQRFAPDVFVVLDVEPHQRQKWVVSHEGRGLDFALEVLFSGDREKDLGRNVRLYAELGVSEYFVYQPKSQHIHGFRLATPDARVYTPILAQRGMYRSEVLGCELATLDGGLRFYADGMPVPLTRELMGRLNGVVETLHQRLEVAEAARVAEQRAREAEQQAREAEQQAREAAEARVAELEARLRELE